MRIKSGMYFYFSADVKSPALSSRAFLYLEPGDVVVPTAVKSHIANGTLSLRRVSLRSPDLHSRFKSEFITSAFFTFL